MKPHHLSYTFLCSFILTIFLLQWWQEPSYPTSLWMAVSFLSLFGLFGLLEESVRTPAALTLALTLGTGAAFGTVARTTHVTMPCSVETYADGRTVILHGIVAEAPDRRPMKTKYTIAADWLRSAASHGHVDVHGKVLVTNYEGWPELNYGDEVRVRGRLQKPGNVGEFPYDKYLSRFDIYSVISRGMIQNHGRNTGDPLFNTLYSWKDRFEYQINRIFPEPHASFLAGLLTGSRRGVPEHVLKDFNATGLTHILAISGYNITIVIALISAFLFFLPLRFRTIPAILGIILFTIFVGASASVVRASIMGILGLLALSTGRQRHGRILILLTMVLMLIWQPKQLWYDASFQLSFLAVIGLSELSPFLHRWFAPLPEIPGITDALKMTIAAQIFAIPWIAFLFESVSLVAPLANVSIALLVPAAMLLGSIGVLASFLWFPLGQLISYVAWGCLELIVRIAHTLASLPFASIPLPWVSKETVLLSYILLFLWLLWLRRPSLTTGTSVPSCSPSPMEPSPLAQESSQGT